MITEKDVNIDLLKLDLLDKEELLKDYKDLVFDNQEKLNKLQVECLRLRKKILMLEKRIYTE